MVYIKLIIKNINKYIKSHFSPKKCNSCDLARVDMHVFPILLLRYRENIGRFGFRLAKH